MTSKEALDNIENNYYLVLSPDGDIKIRKENLYVNSICYETVFYKSYNSSEDLKDNLLLAYEEWEKLIYEELEKLKNVES